MNIQKTYPFFQLRKKYINWVQIQRLKKLKRFYCKQNVPVDVVPIADIRNFSIIAHVDHGKSTLADRLLEITGAILPNSGSQVLDKLQVEKERGITVKAQTASLDYYPPNEPHRKMLLNLIDTPGHVDFSYEVARSLAACQGVILLVDANQGVQAQTVANYDLATAQGLTIVPVLNKIDLKNADPEGVAAQMKTLFGIPTEDILKISAKNGTGIDNVLKAIVERIPAPNVDRKGEFAALIFDSWFDRYKGVIALVYVAGGEITVGDHITSLHTGQNYDVKGLGILRPQEEPVNNLKAGQVGFLISNMRTTKEAHIGDTLIQKGKKTKPLAGFRPARPMVFAGVYPMDQSQHPSLRSAIERLVLTDPGVSLTISSSPALGQGWRLGFLGLLHLEVFAQRLEQEHGALAVLSAPSVTYKATIKGEKNIRKYGGEEFTFNNPTYFPESNIVSEYFEPTVIGTIITPMEYLGGVMSLCMERRGNQLNSVNLDQYRVMLQFHLPLSEIIIDFHDRLKSLTSGYASFDYEDHGYQQSDLVKLNILLNGIQVDELSSIVHVSRASQQGRAMCLKLLDLVPRQQFQVSLVLYSYKSCYPSSRGKQNNGKGNTESCEKGCDCKIG
ncbi:hypothetical protein B566_EDAN003611 [Ephemera danica]|nr:hypothetical protein B566_EDAN003611 [Ephemera danica]